MTAERMMENGERDEEDRSQESVEARREQE